MAKAWIMPLRSTFGIMSLLALSVTVSASDRREGYRWVQYVPAELEGRAITYSADCPGATIDGVETEMRVRSRPGADYPIRVCAVAISLTVKQATIGCAALPLPKAHPNRILLIGDTGCRLKGTLAQACNDLSKWPFRRAADISADLKPDLVLHVGDFHYRENECPVGISDCSGSPYGDTWDAWEADFFSPAVALLSTAPWLMVRGNHEAYDRGGKVGHELWILLDSTRRMG